MFDVYRYCLERADYWREEYEKEFINDSYEYAMKSAYIDIAAMLERTEEINPTKK